MQNKAVEVLLTSPVSLTKLTASKSMEQNPSWEADSCLDSRWITVLAFYRMRKFITLFTRARHRPLSWGARWIQSTPTLFFRFILILSSHILLGLPRVSNQNFGLFYSQLNLQWKEVNIGFGWLALVLGKHRVWFSSRRPTSLSWFSSDLPGNSVMDLK
jgi:hypothetical protein